MNLGYLALYKVDTKAEFSAEVYKSIQEQVPLVLKPPKTTDHMGMRQFLKRTLENNLNGIKAGTSAYFFLKEDCLDDLYDSFSYIDGVSFHYLPVPDEEFQRKFVWNNAYEHMTERLKEFKVQLREFERNQKAHKHNKIVNQKEEAYQLEKRLFELGIVTGVYWQFEKAFNETIDKIEYEKET